MSIKHVILYNPTLGGLFQQITLHATLEVMVTDYLAPELKPIVLSADGLMAA